VPLPFPFVVNVRNNVRNIGIVVAEPLLAKQAQVGSSFLFIRVLALLEGVPRIGSLVDAR